MLSREDSRTWIPDVPDITIVTKMSGEVQYDWQAQIKGLTALLQHRGETVKLAEVMAMSGDAFHLSHADQWEIRTSHSMPIDPLLTAAQRYGYAARWTAMDWTPRLSRLSMPDRLALTQEYLRCLWDEIDKGHPLLFGGVDGLCSLWKILTGYDPASERVCFIGGDIPYEWCDLWDSKARELGYWDMQVRGTVRGQDGSGETFTGGWQANAAFILGEKVEEISSVERTWNALEDAVALFYAPDHVTSWYGGVIYHFGESAYQHLAQDLADMDTSSMREKDFQGGPDIYDIHQLRYQASQINKGRTAAAEFCQQAVRVLPDAGEYLGRAADSYRREARLAAQVFSVFLDGDSQAQETWFEDPECCRIGGDAVLAMLALERTAVQQLKYALDSLPPTR